MLKTFLNIFKVPELRNKVLFTLGLLAIYRIGFAVPLPGIWQEEMSRVSTGGEGGLGDAFEYFAIFTGGNLSQSTIFGLGIMPYITSSIIFQLLATVVPALEKLRREGATGYKKIQEYTRYATVPICVVSAGMWLSYVQNQGWVYPDFRGFPFWIMGLTALVCGTMFLMWLGEQIDEYGIGNGISLIIMAGIVVQMPSAIISVIKKSTLRLRTVPAGATLGPAGTHFPGLCVCWRGGRVDSDHPGQPPYPDPAGQADARSTGLWRAAQLSAASGQSRWRDADHFRQHADDLPVDVAGLGFESDGLQRLADHVPEWVVAGRVSFITLAYVALVYFFAYFWTTV